MMENQSGFCLICNHKHRGVSLCNYCECNWDVSTKKEGETMINWIKKQWQKFIDWVFKGFYKD
jgi:hypothetical protein